MIQPSVMNSDDEVVHLSPKRSNYGTNVTLVDKAVDANFEFESLKRASRPDALVALEDDDYLMEQAPDGGGKQSACCG